MRLRSPQFVITESARSTIDCGLWEARPLSQRYPLLDIAGCFGERMPPTPVRSFVARIVGSDEKGYTVTSEVNGAKGGRRHRWFREYGDAQRALLAWTQRRFRIAPEGA